MGRKYNVNSKNCGPGRVLLSDRPCLCWNMRSEKYRNCPCLSKSYISGDKHLVASQERALIITSDWPHYCSICSLVLWVYKDPPPSAELFFSSHSEIDELSFWIHLRSTLPGKAVLQVMAKAPCLSVVSTEIRADVLALEGGFTGVPTSHAHSKRHESSDCAFMSSMVRIGKESEIWCRRKDATILT